MTDELDPLETVTLLKSDFELLQTAMNVLTSDMGELFDLLGIPVEPPVDAGGRPPREILYTEAFPRIVTLINSFGHVQEAENALIKTMKTAAARFGNKTETFANGQKGLLVGKKDVQLQAAMALRKNADDVQRMSRRERRDYERRHP